MNNYLLLFVPLVTCFTVKNLYTYQMFLLYRYFNNFLLLQFKNLLFPFLNDTSFLFLE